MNQNYTTQMDAARKGIITEQMKIVAEKEYMPVEQLRQLVAEGKVAICANKHHTCLNPEGVGSMLRTKINVNLGVSRDCKDYDVEMQKVMSAVNLGAEAIMDLSSHGNTQPFRQKLTHECPVMIGTVPVYDSVIHYQRDLAELTAQDFIDVVRLHAEDGVDFVTLHCGITRKTIEQIRKHKRKMNIVSRGGSLVFAWMSMTGQENPFYEHFDEILDICEEHDVTISLGDACRPGCLADATDVCQIEELVRLGELTKRAWDHNVQVMVEGPGHVPLDQVAANMEVQKSICMGAPFYVLGPLVTDIALAVASGAAAATYVFENLAHAGDHIVAAKNIYGGTYNLLAHTLPEYGVTATFVDPFNYEEVENAIQENTKAIHVETLGNPNSDVVDIEKLASIAHAHKIPLVVDNTFATPYLVRPIEYGADIVFHSATKFIGGHGTTIGGVIIDSGNFDWEASGKFPSLVEPNPSYHGVSFVKAAGRAAFVTKIRAILLRDTGATISPFHAFIFLQGLETLSLRVERHVQNALKVVEYLNNHPLVEKVNHPSVSDDPEQQRLYKKYFPNGGGSIFTFEIKGGAEAAKKFIDNLELFSLLANVADVKSLVIHPASTTHSQLNDEELADQGIKQNTIRLSIGTENIDDIIEDLDEAFKTLQE